MILDLTKSNTRILISEAYWTLFCVVSTLTKDKCEKDLKDFVMYDENRVLK